MNPMDRTFKAVVALDVGALERARIDRGLLRREVAELSGLNPVTIWRAFSSGLVGVRTARRICDVLGIKEIPWLDAEPRR